MIYSVVSGQYSYIIPLSVHEYPITLPMDEICQMPRFNARCLTIMILQTCNDMFVCVFQHVRRQFSPFLPDPTVKGNYLVTWYDIPFFNKVRPATLNRTFDSCEYNNCVLSISRADVCNSHAVIFKGRYLPNLRYPLQRPVGQVWIFAEEESPQTYDLDTAKWSLPGYKNVFNWTMTYDRLKSDIYLPYGEVVRRTKPVERDFLAIAKAKTKDAIIITSHCETDAKRLEYVHELQEYIQVDVMGGCGQEWRCGELYVHDDCFSILNTTYRYYLAFENSFCRGYRTEKFFENFPYDLLMITRGDMSLFKEEPKDSYIATSEFKSVADLGNYLKSVSESPEKYAELLRKKSQYESLPYEQVYEKSLCEICKRMNFQSKHRKLVSDLDKWRDVDNACYLPTDL